MPLSIVSAPSDITLSKSSIVYTLQATDDQSVPYAGNTIPDGYQVTVQIHFEKTYNSGNFEIVATTKIRPDINGQVEINLAQILDNEIQANFPSPPIPAFDENAPYLLETYKNYYLSYKEDYVDFEGSYTLSSTKSVLYGGLYREGDFFSEASSENSLVGGLAVDKHVSYEQAEFISWYNYTGAIKSVYVEVVTIDQDGTINATGFYNGNSLNVQPSQIVVFPIGPKVLNLQASTFAYSVQVVEQSTDTRFSGLSKYQIDGDYRRNLRYLMYLNIFGAPETIRCTGVTDEGIDVKRRIAAVLQNNTSILRYAKQQYASDFEELFIFRTGYLEFEELDSLKDLLIHNQLFEVSSQGFSALILNTDSIRYNRDQFLFALEFQATPAASQTFSSGLAAVNWDFSNGSGGGGGGTGVVNIEGYDQLYPNQQTDELLWTRKNGEIPLLSRAFLKVLEDGVELTPGPDYSITNNYAPGVALIKLNNFIQGANYRIVAQFITVSS